MYPPADLGGETLMTELAERAGCAVTSEREGDRVRLVPSGLFDLAHAPSIERSLEEVESELRRSEEIEIGLAHIEHIDGAGAVLLARLIDRLDAAGRHVRVVESENPKAARLIALYRERRGAGPEPGPTPRDPLARIGAAAAALPGILRNSFNVIGGFAAAIPKTVLAPRSVNWRSVPDLFQQVGADAFPLTSAANLLVGLIVGLLGVSQLGRFGASSFVPELVVVAHFRELGPLVTAIVVAGRSGAGLASELGTMKVSEEIDALRTMGFDPVRWLVFPRCLALVLSVPLLTWIGDITAVLGGMAATVAMTDMAPRTYLLATANSITLPHFVSGLLKTPFLALAIGMIATAQGLATRGGAAAVGARTTAAVVLAMFAVIVISSVFTLVYAFAGI